VGTDADILIFDPDQKVTVDYRNMETNCDWSPYQGWELTGYPHITLLRGKVIAREGSFVGHVGGGKFIRRKKAIN
jgi:dihydropyrimidinase